MQITHSRKGDYEHKKWLIRQRILGILVFVLTIYGSYIGEEWTPAILGFLFMTSTFMPENKAKEEWK